MTRIVCALFVAAAIAPAVAQQKPPAAFAAYLQGQYAYVKGNLIGSAEKMPAEHFSFRPSPDVRTYAELFGHTMQAQYGYCSTVRGVANPTSGKELEKTVTDKAAVVQMVKDAFAYCDDLFATLTDQNALEIITGGAPPNQRRLARANQLTQLVVHGNEHYGNLVTYMRIKGVVPPSSAQ